MKDFSEFEEIADGDDFFLEMGKFLSGISVGSVADGKPIDHETMDASAAMAHHICLEMLRRYHEWVSS